MKRFIFLALILIFSFTSCTFISNQIIDENSEEEPVITGKILFSGAIPSALLSSDKNNNSDSSARSAILTAFDSLVYKYKINDGDLNSMTVSSGTYSVPVSASGTEFTITINAYISDSAATALLSGSAAISSSSYGDTITQNISLSPSATGTGTVKLAVLTTDSSVIKCTASWNNSLGVVQSQNLTLTANTSSYFTMNGDSAIPAQSYDVTFSFKNSSDAVLYRCREKINVFASLETDKWVNNGSIHIDASQNSGKGALKVDGTCLSVFLRHDFYVSGTPAANGTGTYFDPVDINTALSFITSINDGSSLYTIYLKSDIIAASDNSDWPKQSGGSTNADSYITIDPASSLKLKICSYGNPATPYKIDAARTSTNTGRVVYVGENADVTLENVQITGGCSSYGAGIEVENGSLTIKNCVISGNTAKDTSEYSGTGLLLGSNEDTNSTTITGSTTIDGMISIQGIVKEDGTRTFRRLVFDSLTGTADVQKFKINIKNAQTGDVVIYSVGGYENRLVVYDGDGTTDLSGTYSIDNAGRLIQPGYYFTWTDLCSAVNALTSDSETTFHIGSMTATSTLTNNKPLKLVPYSSNANITITRAADFTSGEVIKASAALSLTGTSTSKITMNGSSAAADSPFITGGGVNINCTYVDFVNCNNSNGGEGGVIHLNSSTSENTVIFSNCNFQNNASSMAGGAICCSDGKSSIQITDCSFVSNTSAMGGAIYEDVATSLKIKDTTFTSNVITETDPVYGAGIYASKAEILFDTLTMTSNTTANNAVSDIVIIANSGVGGDSVVNLNATVSGKNTISNLYYDFSKTPDSAYPPQPIKLNNITGSSIGLQISNNKYTLDSYPLLSLSPDSPSTPTLADQISCFTLNDSDFYLTNEGYLSSNIAAVSSLSSAPSSGKFSVTTQEEFTKINEWLSEDKSMANVTISLKSDIEITSGNWTAVGSPAHPFNGTFDGNNKTIKLSNVVGNNGAAGIFGAISSANIKNLKVEIGSVDGSGCTYVGGIVGKGEGILKIENCSIKSVINANSADYVGGIVGYIDATNSQDIIIRNCININQVAGNTDVGGIVGYAGSTAKSVTIENCANRGQIMGTNKGGIIGKSENATTAITNCCTQYIVASDTTSGCIAGYIAGGDVNTCYSFNNGSVGSVVYIGTSSVSTTTGCHEFSYSGSPTTCVINEAASSTDNGKDVVSQLNNWVTTKNASSEGIYKAWDYEDSAGAIKILL